MTSVNAPMPVHDRIATPRKKGLPPDLVDPNEGLATDAWIKWLQDNSNTLASAATINATVELTAKSASIGTTSITSNVLAAGTYRVTFYARVTTAASVSSSFEITFSWVDGGVTVPVTSTAMTGNTTSTVSSASLLLDIDNNTQVTYAVTYASVGGTAMVYKTTIVLESV